MSTNSRGGYRQGAGRPAAPSTRVRIPDPIVPAVLSFLEDYRAQVRLQPQPVAPGAESVRVPRFVAKVPAGFPSPAEQYLEEEIDLNKHLIQQGHEASTFIIRVQGWSMLGAGIFDGDELVVDRAQEHALNKVVVAVVNGSMTIKRLRKREGKFVLLAENAHYPDRVIAEGDEFEIWGVVTRVLHTP